MTYQNVHEGSGFTTERKKLWYFLSIINYIMFISVKNRNFLPITYLYENTQKRNKIKESFINCSHFIHIDTLKCIDILRFTRCHGVGGVSPSLTPLPRVSQLNTVLPRFSHKLLNFERAKNDMGYFIHKVANGPSGRLFSSPLNFCKFWEKNKEDLTFTILNSFKSGFFILPYGLIRPYFLRLYELFCPVLVFRNYDSFVGICTT